MKKATETFTPQPLPVKHGFKNLTGQKFGRLTVDRYAGKTDCRGSVWHCFCECGTQRAVLASSLMGGKTESCGCLHRERVSASSATHRMCGTTEYSSWVGLRGRCKSPNNQKFQRYGGRGITVCAEWDSFEQFLSDMGPKPSSDHSIDRIDNSLGYYKENCRWATPTEQSNNRRCTLFLEFKGDKKPIAEWALEVGISRHTLRSRVKKRGWPIERALTTPVKGGAKA